ncbi:MAG: sodium-dependent transporter [Anaerophaga sp.]|uniref:sodium-dependent transporter n=1 Tax=Anaerophaga thermohalophila TaxID=177400 RepID=UPI000237CDD1|nr:sodium-dependent transporter [Anaerophaga thermohalophila]MBZ4676010.1 sodium-dependent transporter [Anaerophaga sp.]MDI3520513.1 neurotransmitter:Na+ symporter, family [Anaerophaga sp.]MDK2840904.1 neurotransmitter:Na+ symporter, family [Anaerophaga sp.]MDN5289766.1 neurotransmitter:Na+ symporter, family [Anaerophaga sp.]
MSSNTPSRDSFTNKFGIIAAAAGSAIGLGNIWRFPYVLGENGGGAFLLVYLAFVLIIGVPVMISELLIGRRAQLNVFGAFRKLAPGQFWYLIGVMGVGAAFLILAFYSVVAGWTLHYVYLSLTNSLAGNTPGGMIETFENVQATKGLSVFWTLLFLGATAYIVRSGIEKGIEKYTKVLMPLLLLIILILIVRSVTLEGASEGLAFLFNPDFSKITSDVVLEALGQAFFSLSIGMGVIVTYGSYIKKSESLGGTALSVSLADTLIAVLAGVAIFPAAFAFDMAPNQGPGLVFITLPNIFNQMVGGYFFGLLFFVLLTIAALTSSISLLEVVVAYFTEELKLKRKRATWIAAGITGILGIVCAFNSSVFNVFDKFSSNILLPLGGLLIVIFVGWVIGPTMPREEIEADGRKAHYYKGFLFIIKFVAPVAIALVFLKGLGWI